MQLPGAKRITAAAHAHAGDHTGQPQRFIIDPQARTWTAKRRHGDILSWELLHRRARLQPRRGRRDRVLPRWRVDWRAGALSARQACEHRRDLVTGEVRLRRRVQR
jgi:hypothetical protein